MRRLLSILVPYCLFALAAQATTPTVATLSVSATPAIVSNTVAFGASVTLSVALTPPSATGVVTFFDGPTILGAVTATGSPRTFTTSLFQVGQHSFSAVFQGSGSFGSAVASPTIPLVVTGAGSAEFLVPTGTTPVVSGPQQLVTGDFDSNGKLDLATFYSNNAVAVLLGNGDGTFGTPSILTIPTPGGGIAYPLKGTVTTSAGRLAVVDINQDGILDIVATQSFSVAPANGGAGPFYGFQIVTFLGNGSGGFGSAQTYFEQDPSVSHVPNVEDGPPCVIGSYCQWKDQIKDYHIVNGLAGADFLGTGLFEVAVGIVVRVTSNEEFDDIFGIPSTYGFGPGSGLLSTAYKIWTIDQTQATYATDITTTIVPSSIYLADLQGNGTPDLVIAGTLPTNPKNPAFVAAFNLNGLFTPKTPVTTSNGTTNTINSIATADFTGDGIVDVAVGSVTGAAVYFATSSGVYSSTAHAISSLASVTVSDLAVGDFNADGVPDIIADDGTSKAYVLLNSSASKGTFSATGYSPISTGTSSNPSGILVADFDNDGRQDFATANNTANNITAFLGNIPIITNSPTLTATAVNPVITLTGPYFASNDTVALTVNGVVQSPAPTVTFPTSTSAQVTIPTSAVASASNVLSLTIKDTSTGTSSAALAIPVNGAPVLSGLSQGSATINGSSFTLTLTGTSFPSSPNVYFFNTGTNVTTQLTVLGSPAPTSTSIAVTIPASLLTTTSTANIYVQDLGSGVKSNSQAFTVAPGPQISSISPTFVGAGSPTFTLQINGSDFLAGDTVVWTPAGGTATILSVPTITIQSGTVILATIDSTAFLQTPGTVTIAVKDSNGVSSNIVSFSVGLPVVSAITPTGATTGTSSNVSVTISGSNFVQSSVAQWCNSCNGTPAALSTQYISSTQLTATVPFSLLGAAGTAQINVMNDAQATSATSQVFTIGSLSLSNVSPATVAAGTTGLTVTLTGANFAPASTVLFSLGATTQTLSPTFVSSSELLVTLPSTLLTTAGVASIVVQVGTANSNTAAFSILGPTVTNINPTTSPTGAGSFPIKVTGSNFLSGSLVQWSNGTTAAQNLSTSFQDASDLIAIVPANLVSSSGTALVTVINPGGSISSGIIFTIGPSPTINVDSTGLNPSTSAVGSGVTQISVQGTNFQNGSIVIWNGGGTITNLATGFVSATQLTATVPAALLANSGVATLEVQNPGAVNSNAVVFTIQPGIIPSITPPLSPAVTLAGGPQFQLIVSGTNFVSGSALQWNSGISTTALATSLSNGQLSAIVPASLIASAGTSFVSVLNPGGGASAAVPFTISSNQPTIDSTGGLSPSSATVGGSSTQIIVTGTNFVNGSTVQWNAGASAQNIQTVYVSPTSLTAVVPTSFLATAGSALVTVANPGGAVSNSAIFSVMPAGLPTINTTGGLAPSTALVSSGQFLLSITGANFFSGSTVQWTAGASPTTLATSFISSTQLSAVVPASLLTAAGSAFVGVVNPGGQTSNLVSFTVGAAAGPTIDPVSLTPATATAGGPSFQLSMTGTNFAAGSVVQWNGGTSTQALTSAVQSATQISALVPANLIASAGTAFVSVINTGGATSNVVAYTITVAAPPAAPTINSTGGLNPASAPVGSAAMQLVVSGTNFLPTSVVQWNPGTGNLALSTVYLSSTQLAAIIPTANLAAAGSAFVSVSNGTGSVSNSVSFVIASPSAPTLTTLNPASVPAGAATFQMTLTGTNFNATSVVQWNAGSGVQTLGTVFVNSTTLTAVVQGTLLASVGSAFIDVANTGGGTSNVLTFMTTTATPPAINATGGLSPASAPVGSASVQLSVLGTNFSPAAVVQWNSGSGTQSLATTYISSSQLSAVIPASLLTGSGTGFVTVNNGNNSLSNTVPFSIVAPSAPTISTSGGVLPANVTSGGSSFQITITGTNFLSTSVVYWNAGSATALSTSYISTTQLTAVVPAGLIASAGTVFISVQNPGPLASNTVPFSVMAPNAPTISTANGLIPATTAAAGPGFQLIVVGTGYLSNSVVYWNAGTPTALTTSYVSATQLTAVVPAALIATAGTAFVSVQNPGPLTSNTVGFAIGASVSLPTINASGGLNPPSTPAGGATFQLTVSGSNYVSGSVVQWNAGGSATPLTTGFANANTLSALVPAALVATPGLALITVLNPDKTVSNSVTFNISGSIPVITQLNPGTAPAGSQGVSMVVTGTGFATGASVLWGTTPLPTILNSSTQLTATVGSAQLSSVGSVPVSVQGSGGTSNVLTFVVGGPVITLLSPGIVTAGAPAFTLSVGGSSFVSGAVVNFGGTALTTTFVNPTQLTAAVPANLVASASSVSVTVTNPGGAASPGFGFSIGAVPNIQTIAPTSAAPGSSAFALQVTGANFANGDTVQWNGVPLVTTYSSATSLSAAVTATLLTNTGVVNVSVLHAGGVVSNGVQFTINSATLTSITPTTAPAGSATLQLLVNGNSFVNGSGVQWNGTAVPTTYVSATQLSATINASLLTAVGTAFVNVTNPGGSTTTGTTFSIAGPTLTSISPNSATVGAASLNLTLTGNNFVTGSVATWNGTMLPTSITSATNATAQVAPNLLATAGSYVIVMTNPGGSVTTSQFFTVNAPPAPTISTVTPTSAIAGSSAFQLTVAGSGFLAGSVIQWNGNALTTSVTPTLLSALVSTNLIATAGTANITVQVPGAPLSATTAFPINPPAISSLNPNTVSAGGPAFQLIVTGGNFIPGSTVQWAGTALPTIYNSPTQLTADVTANLIVSGGTASVTVSNGGTVVSAPATFTIGPFTLVITTTSLPDSVVGVSYSQVLSATGGSPNTTGGYTWSVTAGSLPPGITLDPPSGTLSGTATGAALGTVGFTVTDSVNRTVTRSIAFRSVAPLTISTTTPLNAAPAGVAGFSQILTASGGTAPYLWSLTGTLPPGLVLDTNKGVISGTPTVPGSFNFQINLSDGRSQTYSAPFSQTITATGVTIGGLPTTSTSAQQLPVNVTISSPYQVDLNGTLSIVFTSAVGGNDPAIQFSSGGPKVNFTIPAGTTQAVFGQNVLLLTGTTAGSIVVSASITAAGANVTPSPVPSVTITIAKAAPVITGVTFTTSGTSLVVSVTGFSNTRDMTSGAFLFIAATGSTLTAAPITVNLSAAFSTWYQSQTNSSTGTQFTFPETIPFTGNVAAIGSVAVTLVNSAGTSATVTATRQ